MLFFPGKDVHATFLCQSHLLNTSIILLSTMINHHLCPFRTIWNNLVLISCAFCNSIKLCNRSVLLFIFDVGHCEFCHSAFFLNFDLVLRLIRSHNIQVTDLKLSVDLLEKERDFYFAKLRDVEVLCQTPGLENLPVRISQHWYNQCYLYWY